MKRRLIFRPAADQDVDEAFDWYERQRAGLGDEFLTALGTAVERIREHPDSHPRIRGVIRRAVLRRFPYFLFYVVESDRVVILACMHVRRDPGRWPS